MASTNHRSSIRLRIDAVYRLLLLGARRREIIKYAESEGWNAAPRTIDKYIHVASEELRQISEEERRTAFGLALKRLDTLFYKSMTINDFKTALNVQKEINGLHGLGTEKIEHTVTISDSAELRRTIDAAIAADPAIRDRITETLGTGEEEIE